MARAPRRLTVRFPLQYHGVDERIRYGIVIATDMKGGGVGSWRRNNVQEVGKDVTHV